MDFIALILYVAISLGKKNIYFKYFCFHQENNSISVFKPLTTIYNPIFKLFWGYYNILLLVIFQQILFNRYLYC